MGEIPLDDQEYSAEMPVEEMRRTLRLWLNSQVVTGHQWAY